MTITNLSLTPATAKILAEVLREDGERYQALARLRHATDGERSLYQTRQFVCEDFLDDLRALGALEVTP